MRAALAALVALFLCAAADHAGAKTQECQPDPVAGRALYLRGSFNGWTANDTQKFSYHCNRYELVTVISGPHNFKIGDEEWSQDADFGMTETNPNSGPPWRLTAKGRDAKFTFNGNHRLVLNMTTPTAPTLSIEICPTPLLGENMIFLRGTMNNWTTLDDFAFRFRCDAYYLNVRLTGKYEFKIADASWNPPTTFGAAGSATAKNGEVLNLVKGDGGGAGNVTYDFSGEHTLRLSFAENRPALLIGPKSFSDPGERKVDDPIALGVQFNSRDVAHKSPFGATAAGTAIDLSLTALPGVSSATLVLEKRLLEGNQEKLEYTEIARIAMMRTRDSESERWSARHSIKDVGVYGYYFEIIINDRKFIYQNNRDPIFWTRENGSNGLGQIEAMPANRKSIRRLRHTVYAPDFAVPAWSRDAIYYYIFPDRFRNGDARNDPKPGVDRYQDRGVEFHRNWNDRPYKPGSGDGSDDTFNNDFFGGDLAGVIEKLDYIAELGANTIYLTPVFSAASNHKYDTADYKNIDRHFGTNADFIKLTNEAKKRGIRVIPDASLNHTGRDSLYFDRFAKYNSKGAFEGGKIRRDSPYASWYRFDATQSDPDKQYKGWVDVRDLPELNKSSPAFRAFAYGDQDSVMKLWLDRGAAGWRMDVAPWVPDDFWRDWRKSIKQHKPDAITIAETWFDASKFFLGDMFDSTMNYVFRNTILDYANGGNAKKLYQNLELLREVYPPQSLYALMNLLSGHDVARSLHVFGYEDENTAAEKIRDAKQRLRLAAFFQMTYPGSPAIYYGDEVGVTGGEDPYNRAPYPWADKGGKPDLDLLADFKSLIKMRNAHPVLRHGSIEAPLVLDENVIVLLRQIGDQSAITATNNSDREKHLSVSLPPSLRPTVFAEAHTGKKIVAADGKIAIVVPPMFGVALIGQ